MVLHKGGKFQLSSQPLDTLFLPPVLLHNARIQGAFWGAKRGLFRLGTSMTKREVWDGDVGGAVGVIGDGLLIPWNLIQIPLGLGIFMRQLRGFGGEGTDQRRTSSMCGDSEQDTRYRKKGEEGEGGWGALIRREDGQNPHCTDWSE